jgi:DNA-binding MarR family transcriptional regulator
LEQKHIEPSEELIHYILSVDRRLLVIKEFQHRSVLQASDIAGKTRRSLQNVSRALKEFEKKGIVTCITPQKRTWKRYIITEIGKELLNELKNKSLL